MFTKYDIKDIDMSGLKSQVHSFSYTELDNEPSFLHSHSLTEIIIPQTDYCQLVVSRDNIPMQKEYLYVVNPHVMHTELKLTQANKAIYYAVKIDSSILKNDEQCPLFIIDQGGARAELNNYLNLSKKNFDSGNYRLASLNLSCFFLAFIDILSRDKYVLVKEKSGQTSSIISEVKHYISNNYGLPLKIEDICAQFDISHNSLLVKFNKELGISPKEYLNKTRLSAAVYLLSNTDLPISQISTLCGFDSASYFTYIFKKNMHATPKQYRSTPPPSKLRSDERDERKGDA